MVRRAPVPSETPPQPRQGARRNHRSNRSVGRITASRLSADCAGPRRITPMALFALPSAAQPQPRRAPARHRRSNRGVGRITASRLSAGYAGPRRITPMALFALPSAAQPQPRRAPARHRRSNRGVGRITASRLSAGSAGLRPLPGFWAACTSRRQIGINRWRKSPLRHFSAIDFPQTPWDAAKPLIHGLPEAFITSSPTDLSTILQESERAASALMRIGTAPALEQITKISGASVQAGWGIPSFTPGGRRSIRAQPPHPFRGPRYRQAENSPLLCPAVAQRSAPPPSRLGTSVQAG